MNSLEALFSLGAALLLSAMAISKGHAAEPLKAGDVAPDFALQGSDGKMHMLSSYKGKKAVVIAWYPKAFTGG